MLTTIMKPGHYHYEAWLDDTISDSDLVIPGYHVVRRDRDRHGGGVAMFITDCIPFSIVLASCLCRTPSCRASPPFESIPCVMRHPLSDHPRLIPPHSSASSQPSSNYLHQNRRSYSWVTSTSIAHLHPIIPYSTSSSPSRTS